MDISIGLKRGDKMATLNDQLCWSCKKACGGYDCPWANELKPVEGWTAKETTICVGQKGKREKTYRITECPLYEKEKRKRK